MSGAVDISEAIEPGMDAGSASGCPEAGVKIRPDLAGAVTGTDVLIDFSFHKGTAENVHRAAEFGTAMVIGTTGLTDAEKSDIETASEIIPIVMAPNMSLGVNLLFLMVEQAAAALKDRGYDVEIIERHHRYKKDAPSGTALRLGEAAAAGLGLTLSEAEVHGRAGVNETGREPDKIGFHAVRAGDFVGDHTVIFAADGESVELSHRATSRDTFALGALQAAAWVSGRPAGLYSMRDVLGLWK